MMLLINTLIAGGTIYIGTKAYDYFSKKETLLELLNPSRQQAEKRNSSQALYAKGKAALSKFGTEKLTPLFRDTDNPQPQETTVLFEDSNIGTIEEWVNQELVISTISLGLAIPGTLVYPPLLLGSVAGLAYLSIDVWQKAYESLVKKRRINAMVVEALFLSELLITSHVLVAAGCYWALYVALAFVAKAKGSTMNNLVNVFGEQPRSVWVQREDIEVSIPFEAVQPGDVVIVQAGEMIPVDGTIITGIAGIDQRMLTGESQPAEKGVGEKAFAATVVLSGRICIQVEKAGTETVAAQIGNVLNQTTNFAASVELRCIEMADRWAAPYLIFSALALPIFGTIGSLAILWSPFDDAMYVGGPLSVLNYLSIASRRGLLIKDGRVLELLCEVDTIVFDKTGTLTLEQPHVGNIYSCNEYSEDEILSVAAAAEHKQTHPIALAILQAAHERQLDVPSIHDAQYEVGYGLKVHLAEKVVRVGSGNFMAMESISIPDTIQTVQAHCHEQGYSLVYVAIDDELIGAIELHATVRPEAKHVIDELKQRNYELYIISGDHEKPTQALAQELGIDHYFAETLPENKAELIEQLQQEGKSVCFVGDGINDAIALKKAQVSISLRGASTIATDTAQILLMNQSLNQLIDLIDLAEELDANMKRMMLTGAVPSVMIVGGVFFLHLSLYGAAVLYAGGVIASVANAIWPLITHQRKRHTNKLTEQPTLNL